MLVATHEIGTVTAPNIIRAKQATQQDSCASLMPGRAGAASNMSIIRAREASIISIIGGCNPFDAMCSICCVDPVLIVLVWATNHMPHKNSSMVDVSLLSHSCEAHSNTALLLEVVVKTHKLNPCLTVQASVMSPKLSARFSSSGVKLSSEVPRQCYRERRVAEGLTGDLSSMRPGP